MAAALWFVQLVQYPRLAALRADELPGRAAANIRRTSLLLGPVMLLESACCLALISRPPDGVTPIAAWTGLALLAAAWLSTALVQFPIHIRLARGGDPAELARLLRTNRLRVALWSARAALGLWLLAKAGR